MDTPIKNRASRRKGLVLEDALHVQPKHSRLRAFLRAELAANRLKPGEPLPTERELVEALKISRGTVRQALAELERDGLIYRIRGKGSFVREKQEIDNYTGVKDFVLLVPETSHIYVSLLRGFEDIASDHNGQVMVSGTDNDINKQGNLILQLLRKKVAGVAIVPATSSPTPSYHIQELQERGIPVVLLHRRTEGVKTPFISIPFHQIGKIAAESFIQNGHKRIAFIANSMTEATAAYEKSIREVLKDNRLELPDNFIYVGNTSPEEIEQQREELSHSLQMMFEDPDPPTAMFVNGDFTAELLYLLLERMGINIPEDVSLLSVGDTHRQGVLASQITAVIFDEVDIGRRAAELLREMGNGERPIDDESTIVMPISLSEGRTLKPIHKSHAS
jgi:DNA-binding LacI/PurR family transcriptional regulator